MPAMPASNSGRRPDAVDEPHGHDGHNHVHQADPGGRQDRTRGRGNARRLDDGRSVIDYGIDTGDLLEYRQPDPDDQSRANGRQQQIRPAAALLRLLQAAANLIHSACTSGVPRMRARTAWAASMSPRSASQRGLSGSTSMPSPRITPGTAASPSIHRQAALSA